MSDETIRERAKERLTTAELATVLDVPLTALAEERDAPRGRSGQWLAAALVLFGAFVAVGVAWLQSTNRVEVQDPTFDPLQPWFEEHTRALMVDPPVVKSAADVAALPKDADTAAVVLGPEVPPWFDQLVGNPRIRYLMLRGSGRGGNEIVPWKALAKAPALRGVALLAVPELNAEGLRELRHMPQLQSLLISAMDGDFDRPLAEAVAELPHLRAVMLGGLRVAPVAVTQLAGLPHLDTLVLDSVRDHDDALFEAVAGLRQLRALVLARFGRFWRTEPLTAGQLQELERLPALAALDLLWSPVDDDLLAAIPARLRSLTLSSTSAVTPAGLTALVRLANLRCLTFRKRTGTELFAARAELVRNLRLDHLRLFMELPDERLWSVLAGLPKLRGLRLRHHEAQRLADVFLRCADVDGLERLELVTDSESWPAAVDLAPLREVATLRKVIYQRPLYQLPDPTPAEQKMLQDTLGEHAELVIR